MRKYFEQAIENVTKFGDTDIFPFPIENQVIFDEKKATIEILTEIHSDLENWMAQNPPHQDVAIAPAGYSGFRWATQLDPIWNLYFLALVLSIGENIESVRCKSGENRVFSYRFSWDSSTSQIFSKEGNWRSFMLQSMDKASRYNFVVACDISEFYARIGHHRLENAIRAFSV